MAHDHDTTTDTTTAASSHHPRQDGGTLRWLVSPTGRMALNHGGFTVTVFRHGATWGFNLKHTQHHALAVRSQRPYPTGDAAQDAALDALRWAKRQLHKETNR